MVPTAWFNDHWIRRDALAIELDDLGFLQGAIVVDRLRTIAGRALDVEQHVTRFLANCSQIGLYTAATNPSLQNVVWECVARNSSMYGENDFSVVLIATAGVIHDGNPTPNLIVHTQALPWVKLAHWYGHGQRLIIAESRNVPRECWSPGIKSRSRLHYFLADRQARSQGPYAGAILLDLEGNLTETSVANVLLVEADRLVCPPLDSVLNGISLQRTVRLARQLGIDVLMEPCSLPRAFAASGIILTGTSGSLWTASELVGTPDATGHPDQSTRFDNSTEHPIARKLGDAWKRDIQFDFVKQAIAQSSAMRLPE